ncbi:MAG: stage 0 sporulation protein [Candidatus Omnitrophica bacterium CG_4_9_14_0_2_um_filter_42_8]|nr:MAG: stage 0 sporulation protein [Candidatus Omnitrophica bacterium CG22_combo_CG10-13_8_21_14_all_43_16]PJC48621.1 MAG: stage 0 sporulation protein [Candidatus Omnitrophica bacterium CG_4_9_14_0_2_um_filter_42_8]
MQGIIEVRIRESGNIVFYNTEGLQAKVGDYVIIDAERGQDYAQVIGILEKIPKEELKKPLKKIIRVATREDVNQINENKKRIKDAFQICAKKIQERKLEMKLIDAEYSFDGTKLIFYFTSEDRVDFRELVKDLAHIFKVRIELKQIGVRDEARMLGGFGHCGRPLCCASFLKGFDAVTIRMAKEQNLSLNPTKISGVCGRLMCCLSYEYENYKKYLKGLPKEGEKITVPEGKGKVISVNALKRKVLVRLEEGTQIELDYTNK